MERLRRSRPALAQLNYANVKAHKDANREVLYCIREKCNLKALKSGAPPNIDRYKKEYYCPLKK